MDTPSSPSLPNSILPLLVFTDLDGTLLDHDTYSHEAALPALEALQRNGIPCIFNTSKTIAELVPLRKALNNTHPFIAENGAGIAIPQEYPLLTTNGLVEKNGFLIKSLGVTRTEVLEILTRLASEFNFIGFSNMSVSDISALTGLSESEAQLAMRREFTEPIVWRDDPDKFDLFLAEVESQNLSCLRGGRFIHIMGNGCDKGEAMRWIFQSLKQVSEKTVTVALGDSNNDLAMLRQADVGVLVRSIAHAQDELLKPEQGLQFTQLIGPAGWNAAILDILASINLS